MALYVYRLADGVLVSWSPGDSDPVADDLAANGLVAVSGLAALDSTHAWDPATHAVVEVTPPAPPQPLPTAAWIMRFTPQEFAATMVSSDPAVQQFVYALNHTVMVDLTDPLMVAGVAYLASSLLLSAERAAAIMAAP